MPITVATWNVNSIKARMHAVTGWLKDNQPDVACLQELKTTEDGFPFMELESLGYNIRIHGQKSYNGVALLSKQPFESVTRGLPGDDKDDQARYMEAIIMGRNSPFRVASIYLPNGNPVPGPKYDYKLAWMTRLKTHAENLLKDEEPFILAGDYNVIPRSGDVHDPKAWEGDALYRPETHAAFRALLGISLTEAFDQMDGRFGQYTFWDYKGGAWPQNRGLRIDHLLLSPQAADRIRRFTIHRDVREGVRPSDHVPVVGKFDL